MAKRKKRNTVTLVSLLLALVVLIALYVWYNNRQTTKPEDNSTDKSTTTLATLDTSKATKVQIIGSDMNLALTLKDGVWQSDSDPSRPIDQDKVKNILDTMSEVKATQTVTDKPEDLSEFGLKEPVHKISVTLSDGKSATLLIGDQTVSGDGYYAQVNDSKTVYILDTSYAFDYKDNDFTTMESPKGLVAKNITYIGVDNRDGEDYELKKIDSGATDNCGAVMYKWRIVKPFGEGYSADSAAVSDIQNNYSDFTFSNCADYSGKDLAKYGLDNPISKIEICYGVDSGAATPTPAASGGDASTNAAPQEIKGFTLYVGNKTDSGDYYVKTGNSNLVYTFSGDKVTKMLSFDPFKIMTPYVNIPNIDNVDKITTEIDGKEYTMDITRTPSTDKNSTDVKEAFSYNGKAVDEQLFRDVYKKLITPRYDSWLTDKVDTDALKAVMTINIHLTADNGQTISTTFYPYDKSFYIVDKGTGVYFLTDKRAVDDMVKAVSTFTAD